MAEPEASGVPWVVVVAGVTLLGALGVVTLSIADPPPEPQPPRLVENARADPDFGSWQPFADASAADASWSDSAGRDQ